MAKQGFCSHFQQTGGCDYGHHDVSFDGGVQAKRILRKHQRGGKERELWDKVHHARRLEDRRINDLKILRAKEQRISQEGRKAQYEIAQNRKKANEEVLHRRIAQLEEQVRRGKRARKVSPSTSP